MKDKNGIEKNCSNCRYYEVCASNEVCEKYVITVKAYEARIAELQNELDETKKKLTETVKLLSEASRECGKLEAYNEVLQRRVEEFSMELLDRTMKENKDVLERLKNWEEYLDKDMPTQSTDAADVSKNGENSTESEGNEKGLKERAPIGKTNLL